MCSGSKHLATKRGSVHRQCRTSGTARGALNTRTSTGEYPCACRGVLPEGTKDLPPLPVLRHCVTVPPGGRAAPPPWTSCAAAAPAGGRGRCALRPEPGQAPSETQLATAMEPAAVTKLTGRADSSQGSSTRVMAKHSDDGHRSARVIVKIALSRSSVS